MKVLCIILSIVTLVLAVHPCASCTPEEAVACGQDDSRESQQTVCSPFATCCGSTGFTFSGFLGGAYLAPCQNDEPEASAQQIFTDQYCPGIWQPPKIRATHIA